MNSIMPIQQNQSSKRRFPLRVFAAAFVISLLTLGFSGWQSWQVHERVEEMSRKHITLTEDVGRIMLFDEVLTMSAHMAAATGDFSYEKRYDQFDAQLTTKIDKVRAALPQAEIAQFINETDEANNALVKIERQAFALTHQGKQQEAMALLTGAEYLRLKKTYAGGMEKTVNAANGLIETETQYLHSIFFWFSATSSIGILALLAMWFFAARSARSWAAERKEAADALQKVNNELEVRVQQRTAELLDANEQLQREISERKKAQLETEQALNIQRVLDSILNISLPPMTLKEVLLKALDTILSIPTFSLLNKGAIFLAIKDEQILEMVAQRNLPAALLQSCAMLPFGRCLCGKAAATREMVFSSHLNDQHEISYDGIQPHGHYCLPIMLEGELLGVLNTYVASGHVSNENEKTFLKTVVDTLAVVIERKQTEEKLQQLAHNDTLTGLPNRALFRDRLEQGLALAQRHRQELAVLFLDLDHFKEINDTLGHDMGDVLLRETANRLLACVRKTDTVARMGGDEFTVLLTETKTPESSEQVAQNILKALLEPFELNGTLRNVGCSIGIARYPEHGADSETLLKNADAAMYHAKRKRNAFCSFSKNL